MQAKILGVLTLGKSSQIVVKSAKIFLEEHSTGQVVETEVDLFPSAGHSECPQPHTVALQSTGKHGKDAQRAEPLSLTACSGVKQHMNQRRLEKVFFLFPEHGLGFEPTCKSVRDSFAYLLDF